SQVLGFAEKMSQGMLIGGNWLTIGLMTSPLLLYRWLLLPPSLNFVKLGACYLLIAILLVVFIDTGSVKSGDAALTNLLAIVALSSAVVLFPLGLAVCWTLIALASQRMRFARYRAASPLAYLRSL